MNESTPFVEICVTTEARIDIEFGSIVVVAITGPKIGALNQATGMTLNLACVNLETAGHRE